MKNFSAFLLLFAAVAGAQTKFDPGRIDWNLNPSTDIKANKLQGLTLNLNDPTCTAGTYAKGDNSGCGPGGGLSSPSANVNNANAQVQADSVVQSAVNGLQAFGDSVTAGAGSSGAGYISMIGTDLGITPTNNGVAGDRVGDETWHIFSVLNPGDAGNAIVTSMIGTNNTGSVPTSAEYSRQWLAGHAWAALSSTNKILAAGTTIGGTTSTDSTFSSANGKTCTSGPCTFTYTASVGTPGVFYVWYKMVASGANISATVDGSAATDTVTNSSTISTSWVTSPNVQTSTVGLARFVASNASHTIVVTVQTGGTFLGFGFPPVKRYRGVSHPRIVAAGVIPQQNNANASNVASVNGYNLAGSKLLVGDGLDVPFVDANSLDPVLDMSSSITQNCTASTNPGLHPNICGHTHLAQLFESVIGAVPSVPSPNIAGPVSVTHLSAPTNGTGFDWFQPHSFGDTLIHKLMLGNGMFGGVGQYKNPTGGSFGIGVYSDSGHEVGLGFSNSSQSGTTAESNFTWPLTLTSSLLQTFFSSEFLKFSASGLCWGASGCTPIAASNSLMVAASAVPQTCSAASCTVTLTTAATFQRITLTANVTTFTFSWPAVAGFPITIDICQDATGGRTLATPTAGTSIIGWPSNLIAASTAPSTCTTVQGVYESGSSIYFASLSTYPVYSVSWTPVAATVSSCVAQTVTVTGLATGQPLIVSPPSGIGSHVWIGASYVSAANTANVTFCADSTGGTPPSGSWTFQQ
jgi:hypothetical protein